MNNFLVDFVEAPDASVVEDAQLTYGHVPEVGDIGLELRHDVVPLSVEGILDDLVDEGFSDLRFVVEQISVVFVLYHTDRTV